ncbi:bifunctional UDP-sugar hydrolase/5'-nucleotidase [Elioraea sp.]|uniref:bifunctional metallophosphatase/5'-nucleotidase n=1 Tax=Elioraea sp. TaxID=2185103 RepID=UPI0021DE8CCB|nr:bifunctional metallophosphatase/5'-nucleotidase [Elioraea sp.]GIX11265.1 MAG: multifunctional 2',3'-cyclic-nucleotide 2'-phosphodiesterase/5'-nucleotidase/3'-nucleotidase [Elioraea sp.]
MRLTRRLLLSTGAAALAAPAILRAAAPIRLTILHSNDVHSRHEPINRLGAACRAEEQQPGACFGGSARLAAAIAGERAAAEAAGRIVLTLDAGDQFMGSLYYTHWRGEAERQVMNAIRYDAMAVGNHEFDNGPPVLARFAASLDCPLLSANVDAGEEPSLGGLIRPATVIERGGVRIGVVGLTTVDTPRISSPGPRVRFGDEEAGLRAGVAQARASGAEVVVALTHVGLEADRRLAAAVPGISAVIGGHSHTLLSNAAPEAAGRYPLPIAGATGFAVPVVQAGAFNRWLGRLDLDLDRDGRVLAATGDARALGFADPRDPAVEALLARLAAPLAALRAQVVGSLAEGVANAGCRSGECALGNMVAEAMLDAARGAGAVVALQNGGGLRSGLPAGAVTWGDVLTVLPFSNTLATLRLSGADLRAALEAGLAGVERGAGAFPQVAGLRLVWRADAPAGRRVVSVELRTPEGGFAPLDEARLYGVVTNNFLRQGGDGYAVLRDRAIDPYDSGPNLEEVFAAWLGRHSPVRPATDGRIVRRQ